MGVWFGLVVGAGCCGGTEWCARLSRMVRDATRLVSHGPATHPCPRLGRRAAAAVPCHAGCRCPAAGSWKGLESLWGRSRRWLGLVALAGGWRRQSTGHAVVGSPLRRVRRAWWVLNTIINVFEAERWQRDGCGRGAGRGWRWAPAGRLLRAVPRVGCGGGGVRGEPHTARDGCETGLAAAWGGGSRPGGQWAEWGVRDRLAPSDALRDRAIHRSWAAPSRAASQISENW